MIILDISRGKDSMRLGNLLDAETETHRDWKICWILKTETHRDWKISWMSRPRLIETEKFVGCRDRDSLRLGNLADVETETHRDWEICWMSRPRPVETGQKMSIPRLHRDSRWSLMYYHVLCYNLVIEKNLKWLLHFFSRDFNWKIFWSNFS